MNNSIKILLFLFLVEITSSCTNVSSKRTLSPKMNPQAVSFNSLAPDEGLADPHIWIDGDSIYCMTGHDKSWDVHGYCHMDKWELWVTTDLKKWKHKLNIYPEETYIGRQENCFAGDLAQRDGKFYWYFSNKTYSIGVMRASSMSGPWKDALGKPLIPENAVKTKIYDPEIFVENGVYTMFFGNGHYYGVTLGKDMISLASKPKLIKVQNEDGSFKRTADKSCLWKRGNWYYLSWGNYYAMSRNLYGPYTYKGAFLEGGHGSVFKWKNQWYSIQENHETNAYYRGIQLRPLYFNADSTVYIPKNNYEYPLPGRVYDFKYSTMGWGAKHGTTFIRTGSPEIRGTVSEKGALIASSSYLHTSLDECNSFIIRMRNESDAKELKIGIYSYGDIKGFTHAIPPIIDWEKVPFVTVPLKLTRKAQILNIPLSMFKNRNKFLNKIAIQPISDVNTGDWVIEEVRIK